MRRLAPLIYSIVFLDALLMFAIVPLLPSYARDLGLSTTQAGIVVAVYSGTVLVAGLPAGRAADRFGARQVTIVGIALLAVSTGAYGFSHTFLALLVARMGQGVSSAISWSAGLAWLSEASPAERRPAALGAAMAAGSTGALVGPVVGGPLGEHLGIRAPFVIFAGVAAVLTVWALFEPGARGHADVTVGVRDLPRLAARNQLIAAALLVTLIVAVVSGRDGDAGAAAPRRRGLLGRADQHRPGGRRRAGRALQPDLPGASTTGSAASGSPAQRCSDQRSGCSPWPPPRRRRSSRCSTSS